MKCLIFGSNGYVGKHLSYYLSERNWDVRNYDLQEISDQINYERVDIRDVDALKSIAFDVDYIFWFSGLTGTLDSFTKADLFIDVNEKGLINLLNILRERNLRPHIIFPSSRLVYEGIDEPLRENSPKEAKTIYAANKLACESYLYAYSEMCNIPYTVYRICVPYGNTLAKQYAYGTIGFFVKKASLNENIVLYGDGSLKRTFTHIKDLCYQIIETCTKEEAKNRIFNIGGETLSLKEAAQLVALNFGVGVEYVDWPELALKLESGHTYFDDTAIQTLLCGYEFERMIEQSWV